MIVFHKSYDNCYRLNYKNNVLDMLLDLICKKYYKDYICVISILFAW
jgi:hypothetical protein